jgi:hypothetical protein
MSSSDSYYIEILRYIIIYTYRYGNPVIYILGNIGNLLSAIIFSQKTWRKNVCVFYFKVCLLLSSMYLNSTVLAFTFLIGFNINVHNSNVMLCKLFYYLSFCISTLLPTVLILATIDRLFISSQYVNSRLYNSKYLAYIFISLSTFFWLVFNSNMFIKSPLQEIDPSIFRCVYDQSELFYDYVYYSLLINDVLFWLIILILCIFSFQKVCRIRAVPRQQRNQIRSIRKKDFQLLRCLFVYNVIYIISNVCSVVYSVYGGLTRNKMRTSSKQMVHTSLNDLVTFLSFMFYSASFFIFLTISKAFRHELKRMVYKMFGKNYRQIRRKQHYNVRLNSFATIVIVPLK